MIRRADITVSDSLGTPEPGVYITVKDASGALASIYDDSGNPMGNPLVSGIGGGFYYNIQDGAAGAYTEEYRLSLSDSPRTVRTVALDTSTSAGGMTDYLMPEWFGAVGDGVTDDYAAFVAMRTQCIALRSGSLLFAGPEIRLSKKTYLLGTTFDWKGCTNIWRGVGSGMAQFPQGSVIKMAAGKTFVVNRGNTELGTTGTAISDAGGDNTQFHDIAFEGPGKGVGTAPVVWWRARAQSYNCTYTQGGGDGLRIHATAGGGTTTEGNANCWLVVGGACSNNGGNGLSTLGADANAGTAIGTSFDNSGAYGTSELSFLGNAYLGCHWASNTTAHVNNTGASNASVFTNYFEIEGTTSTLAVGSRAEGKGATSSFPAGAVLGASDPTGSGRSVVTGAGGILATFTGGGKTGATMADVRSDYPGVIQTHSDFSYSPRWGARVGTGVWVWELSFGNTLWLMGLNGNSGTRYNFGLGSPPSGILGISAFALGYEGWNPDGRIIAFAAAAPTTGEHARGEIRFNDAPSASGKIGWVCVTGGTPGTWKAFGAIDA